VIAANDGLMDLHLLRAAGIRLGINSQGKLKGIVDY
jgi:phosphoserine phosphatase